MDTDKEGEQVDNSSHVMAIDAGDESATKAELLLLIARYKGVETAYETLTKSQNNRPRPLGIRLRGVTIEGFWPALEFLNDIYRVPEILTVTPEGRAALRSLTAQLLAGRITPSQLITRYYERGRITLPKSLNLIDFAIAATGDASQWVCELTHRLHELIGYETQGFASEYER